MESVKQAAGNLMHKLRGDEPVAKEEENVPKREESPSKRSTSPSKRSESPTKRAQSPKSKREISPTRRLPQQPYRPVQPFQQLGQVPYQHQFDFRNLNKDPTVNHFNSLFNRETHNLLGRTGVKVSRICLGAMNFGKLDENFAHKNVHQTQLDESEAHKILDRFVELGGNCIDTANFFPWFGSTCGDSERIIGNWLANRADREGLVIITKMRLPTDPDPKNISSIGLSRSNVIASVENSLKRLQTNYIDFLQVDGWDNTVHVKEIIRVLDELCMSGKVRNIGACDFKGWQLQRMIDTSKYLNKHSFTCFEGEYNLLSRGCEMEVVDVCLNHDLGFIAFSPFKYGFLSGPSEYQQQGALYESTTQTSFDTQMEEPFEIMRRNPCYQSLFNAIQNISTARNIPMSQIALRWVLQKEFVSTVVVGVDNIEELEEAMKTLTEFYLTEEEMIQLDRASIPYLPYPYLSIPTDIGRKLYSNTPGPIVYSQLAYLTQAITLNDRQFDFGYKDEYYRQSQQVQQPLLPGYEMKHERNITVTDRPYLVKTDVSAEQVPALPLQANIPESTKESGKESYQYLVSQQHRQASPPRT